VKGGGLGRSAAEARVFAKIGYQMFLESPIKGDSSFMFRAPEIGALLDVLEGGRAHHREARRRRTWSSGRWFAWPIPPGAGRGAH
jgi:hypothetical protein